MKRTYVYLGAGTFSRKLIDQIKRTESARWLRDKKITCQRDEDTLEFVFAATCSLEKNDIEKAVELISQLYQDFVDITALTEVEIKIQNPILASVSEALCPVGSYVALWDELDQKANIDMGQTDQFSQELVTALRAMVDLPPSKMKDFYRSFNSQGVKCFFEIGEFSETEAYTFTGIRLLDADVDTFFRIFKVMLKGYLTADRSKNDPRVVALLEECKKFFV